MNIDDLNPDDIFNELNKKEQPKTEKPLEEQPSLFDLPPDDEIVPDVPVDELPPVKEEPPVDTMDDLANDIINSTFGFFEKAGDVAKNAFEKASEKANTIKEKLHEKHDQMEKEYLEQEKIDSEKIGHDMGGSLLDGKDSLFDKASDFLNKFDKKSPPPPPSDKMTIKKIEQDKSKDDSFEFGGYDDHDGDGNPLVDDAIIDED